MRHMSIQRYGREVVAAKTPWAKASLFIRSLTLRYWLWKGRVSLEKIDRYNRQVRSQSDAFSEQGDKP